MPFFTEMNEAERYARYRPYFHPLAIARAKEAAQVEGTFPLALDVACGTGQSATALTALAKHVIGCDISWNMLANATRSKQVRYVQARAEAMPFGTGSIPLIACALAFHWFDRDQFLSETARVLVDGGLLLIYNNGFTGIMKEDPAFQEWSWTVYPERFPVPPRDSRPFNAEEVAGSEFAFIQEERYENEVNFTPEALVAYLMTQTNVASAVEEGQDSYESAGQWLLQQVRPFFTAAEATFIFVTRAWTLRLGNDSTGQS